MRARPRCVFEVLLLLVLALKLCLTIRVKKKGRTLDGIVEKRGVTARNHFTNATDLVATAEKLSTTAIVEAVAAQEDRNVALVLPAAQEVRIDDRLEWTWGNFTGPVAWRWSGKLTILEAISDLNRYVGGGIRPVRLGIHRGESWLELPTFDSVASVLAVLTELVVPAAQELRIDDRLQWTWGNITTGPAAWRWSRELTIPEARSDLNGYVGGNVRPVRLGRHRGESWLELPTFDSVASVLAVLTEFVDVQALTKQEWEAVQQKFNSVKQSREPLGGFNAYTLRRLCAGGVHEDGSSLPEEVQQAIEGARKINDEPIGDDVEDVLKQMENGLSFNTVAEQMAIPTDRWLDIKLRVATHPGIAVQPAKSDGLTLGADVVLTDFEGPAVYHNGNEGELLRFISEDRGWLVRLNKDTREWTITSEHLLLASKLPKGLEEGDEVKSRISDEGVKVGDVGTVMSWNSSDVRESNKVKIGFKGGVQHMMTSDVLKLISAKNLDSEAIEKTDYVKKKNYVTTYDQATGITSREPEEDCGPASKGREGYLTIIMVYKKTGLLRQVVQQNSSDSLARFATWLSQGIKARKWRGRLVESFAPGVVERLGNESIGDQILNTLRPALVVGMDENFLTVKTTGWKTISLNAADDKLERSASLLELKVCLPQRMDKLVECKLGPSPALAKTLGFIESTVLEQVMNVMAPKVGNLVFGQLRQKLHGDIVEQVCAVRKGISVADKFDLDDQEQCPPNTIDIPDSQCDVKVALPKYTQKERLCMSIDSVFKDYKIVEKDVQAMLPILPTDIIKWTWDDGSYVQRARWSSGKSPSATSSDLVAYEKNEKNRFRSVLVEVKRNSKAMVYGINTLDALMSALKPEANLHHETSKTTGLTQCIKECKKKNGKCNMVSYSEASETCLFFHHVLDSDIRARGFPATAPRLRSERWVSATIGPHDIIWWNGNEKKPVFHRLKGNDKVPNPDILLKESCFAMVGYSLDAQVPPQAVIVFLSQDMIQWRWNDAFNRKWSWPSKTPKETLDDFKRQKNQEHNTLPVLVWIKRTGEYIPFDNLENARKKIEEDLNRQT